MNNRRSRFAGELGLLQRYGVILIWAVLILGFGIKSGSTFLSWSNFSVMFSSQTVLLVLALGLMLPLNAGDLDLSVASVLTLSSILVAVLNVQHGVNVWVAVIVALAASAGVGLFNGLLVELFSLDAVIVTLGVSTVLTGVILLVSGSSAITGVSQGLVNVTWTDQLFGLSYEFYFGIAMCILMWYFIDYTPAGRRIIFVGRNRSVARLSGVNVRLVRIGCFTAGGLLYGFAGILSAGTTAGADPTSGATFLLPAFAACALGTTTYRPGYFTPFGLLISVYFLVTGITGLQQLGVQSYVQQLFYGGALLVAVVATQLVGMRRARRQARARSGESAGSAETVSVSGEHGGELVDTDALVRGKAV